VTLSALAKFAGALRAKHSAQEASIDDARYINRSVATALTHPEGILQALNEQTVRDLQPCRRDDEPGRGAERSQG
jgi:hypothetical protein